MNPETVMKKLFAIAGGMQNVETKLNFYDLFEKQELFDLWQCTNYRLYVNDANAAINNGLMFENQKPTLKNILENANKIITSKGKGATLRFAHDGNIIPLAMLLHLEGSYNSISDTDKFYEAWSDFKVAPMAGNIQIVFFRKPKSGEILVKFLLHEKEILVPTVKTDIAPYYNWRDVESYYKSMDNQIDYRDGAETFNSDNIETQLLYGIGRAYGLELLFKKKKVFLLKRIPY